MMRVIYSTLAFVLLTSSPALAGFEWVPPSKAPIVAAKSVNVDSALNSTMSANNMADPMMHNNASFPAPSVIAEPLMAPTPITPAQQSYTPKSPAVSAPAPRQKNLSRNKLYIDPYPLKNNAPNTHKAPIDPTEVYKAMNEKAGKLHPVKLGNGLSTGAKPVPADVPKAVRTASMARKTFLTPTGNGMTPMMGAEPAPLPGYSSMPANGQMPRAPASSVEQNRIYAEAIGFGRDLPLALALSQVIPSDFTHSFASDVNPGVTVSWEGGQAWNEVLNDMLRDKKMTAVIRGNQVTIQPMAKL